METEKPSIKPIAYSYGLYLALVSIVMLVIMYVANIQKSWPLSIISILLTVLVFVYGIKAYKQKNNGFLSLGDAIKVGLAIAVIGGIIAAIYSYIHYSYIYPEFVEITKDQARTQMLNSNPDMTEAQIEQAMKISGMFTTPLFFSFMSVIGSLFMGLIISLIAGLVMKKENTHA
ncbi:MAG: DUF4199 domain-containing protein [Gelidibacter sp.]|nr:DUF4199 domain-containing protein [Gelidibacter sp.]